MSKIEELKQFYKNTDTLDLQLDFIEKLLENNEEEIIDYHYNLLKERDDMRFFHMIRSDFKKRGSSGKSFLLHKIQHEKDLILKSEALFIIGGMKNLEENDIKIIKETANEFINKKYDYTLQYYGIIILGWLGKKEEISILSKELFENNDENLAAYAASALRQIWYNHKRLKKQILNTYFKSLVNNNNNNIESTVIACVQELLQRKFGIKESQYGEIYGDLDEAKAKTLKALQKELL